MRYESKIVLLKALMTISFLIAAICYTVVIMSACIPKHETATITDNDLETILVIKSDALDLIGFMERLHAEDRGPTEEEMENIRMIAQDDITAFKAVMERVAESKGKDSLVYMLLQKILLGML